MLSTNLNADIVYEDYIKNKGSSEKNARFIMKIIVVIIGMLYVFMAIVVKEMGNVVLLNGTI